MIKTLSVILLAALSAAAAPAGQVPPQPSKPSFPPDLMAAPAAAVVVRSVENMFRDPTATSDVVSQALLGDNVKVLKTEKNAQGEDWVRIETPDTYPGWILASALRFLKPGNRPYTATQYAAEGADVTLRVHDALESLALVDDRLAQVVQMRYFGGYSEGEIADTLEITERTVQRLWQKARLMLAAVMEQGPPA